MYTITYRVKTDEGLRWATMVVFNLRKVESAIKNLSEDDFVVTVCPPQTGWWEISDYKAEKPSLVEVQD